MRRVKTLRHKVVGRRRDRIPEDYGREHHPLDDIADFVEHFPREVVTQRKFESDQLVVAIW